MKKIRHVTPALKTDKKKWCKQGQQKSSRKDETRHQWVRFRVIWAPVIIKLWQSKLSWSQTAQPIRCRHCSVLAVVQAASLRGQLNSSTTSPPGAAGPVPAYLPLLINVFLKVPLTRSLWTNNRQNEKQAQSEPNLSFSRFWCMWASVHPHPQPQADKHKDP